MAGVGLEKMSWREYPASSWPTSLQVALLQGWEPRGVALLLSRGFITLNICQDGDCEVRKVGY